VGEPALGGDFFPGFVPLDEGSRHLLAAQFVSLLKSVLGVQY
jgi:hypothetical protein